MTCLQDSSQRVVLLYYIYDKSSICKEMKSFQCIKTAHKIRKPWSSKIQGRKPSNSNLGNCEKPN